MASKKEIKTRNEVINKESTPKKNERRTFLSNKVTAVLYFLCGICWISSAIMNIKSGTSYIFDLALGIVFISLGVFYLCRDKKERKHNK